MFNPAETGLLGPYITRKMRRRAERLKPVNERPPKNTLGTFLMAVKQAYPQARVENNGYRGGARMMFETQQFGNHQKGGRMVASFRHPTKRATPGRMNFVTVTA